MWTLAGVCVLVCLPAVFTVHECVMFFFAALHPGLTVHLLRLWEGWYCQAARGGGGGGAGGVAGWNLGREVQKEKEWPSADSRTLITGVKSSFCGSLQEGKQTRSWSYRTRERDSWSRFVPGMSGWASTRVRWFISDSDFCFVQIHSFCGMSVNASKNVAVQGVCTNQILQSKTGKKKIWICL